MSTREAGLEKTGVCVPLHATVYGIPLTWYTLHMAGPNAALSSTQSPNFTSFRMHSLTTQLEFMSPFSNSYSAKNLFPLFSKMDAVNIQVQSLSRVQLFVPHELQHARPPCPSPAPTVHPNSSPSSQ